MANRFEELAADTEIYPLKFVEMFGIKTPFWETATWSKRERSLCHDMCCILLSNSEPSSNLDMEMINNLKRAAHRYCEERESKKRKIGVDETDRMALDEEDDFEEITNEEEGKDESDSEYDSDIYEENTFEQSYASVTNYRYIVLEGLLNAGQFQKHYSEKWGLRTRSKMYDIIDTKEKLFIEVKTTVNPVPVIEEYSNNEDTDINTSLIVIDLDALDLVMVNKQDEMPGLSKMMNFIILRRAKMTALGIHDDIHDDGMLSDIVIGNNRVKDYLEAFKIITKNKIERSVDGDIPTHGFHLESVEKEALFNLIKNPLEIQSEECVEWKGKLTPHVYCQYYHLQEEEDIKAIDIMMDELSEGIRNVTNNNANLQPALEEVIKLWIDGENRKGKNFKLLDTKDRSKIPVSLAESLRIGAKKRTYLAEINDAVQQKRERLSEKKYDKWFETLYEDFSQEHIWGAWESLNLDPEKESEVPLYKFLGEWIQQFNKSISQRNIGVFMNQISNFYSRITGAYALNTKAGTSHSQISVVPLKITLRKDDQIERFMTGIAIRGPHHTRSPTDKTNFLIVERIDPESLPKNFYRKYTTVKVGQSHFMIRQTAIKKIDGIHLTFIDNALFMASNMIGDVLMHHPKFVTEEDFKMLCREFLTNRRSMNFFVDRVIDSVMMAVIGNARDEGFLTVFRKLIMILINDRRGESSFSFSTKGLCEALNECIIDNPLGMHLTISLLFSICYD